MKVIDVDKMKLDYQNKEFKEGSYKNDLDNEINILKLLSNFENSVKYYGDYDKDNLKIIILEKCDEDLNNFMKRKKKSLTVEEIRKILIGLNKVFKVMQREGIIHRDLKLENLLIKYKDENKKDFLVKLSDYGIAKYASQQTSSISGLKGTPETVAPEILMPNFKRYNSLVDIFSLGVILYQLSHNLNHPFGSNLTINYNYTQYFDSDNFELKFDSSIKNEDFKNLLRKMLRLNPKNRLSWEEYFKHPFNK